MHPLKKHKLSLAAAALLLSTTAVTAADGPLIRHSAEFFRFDGTEFTTTLTAGLPLENGALFYKKKVRVHEDSNVAYITIFTTGDSHNGADLWLGCFVKKRKGQGQVPCRASPPSVDGAPSGYVNLLSIPEVTGPGVTVPNCNDGGGGNADCHDNSITYSWCTRLPKDARDVTFFLRLATSDSGDPVFIEKGHVYIESSFIEDKDGNCDEAQATADFPEAGDGDAAAVSKDH